MPKRIQRKRAKGWRMPPNTVYVGRGSKYGNPFIVGEVYEGDFIIDNQHAKCCFADIYADGIWKDFSLPSPDEIKKSLKGKDLACWCPLDKPCHADILLKIANHTLRGRYGPLDRRAISRIHAEV